SAGAVPTLPGSIGYVAGGFVPGGLHRNREYYVTLGGGITIDPGIDPDLATLLFDPQTSGGLLVSVADNELADLVAAFDAHDLPYWVIGQVNAGSGIVVSA